MSSIHAVAAISGEHSCGGSIAIILPGNLGGQNTVEAVDGNRSTKQLDKEGLNNPERSSSKLKEMVDKLVFKCRHMNVLLRVRRNRNLIWRVYSVNESVLRFGGVNLMNALVAMVVYICRAHRGNLLVRSR